MRHLILGALLALTSPAFADQVGNGPARLFRSPLNLPASGACTGASYNIDSGTLVVDCTNNAVNTGGPLTVIGSHTVTGTALFKSTVSVSGDFAVGGSTTLATVGGRVGIGTAAPLTTLDVNGAATLRGATTVSGSSLTATAGIGGHSVAGGLGLIGTVTSESSATFKALVGGIVANGGLGINTALTVNSGGASSGTFIGTSDTASLELYSRGGSGEDWAVASAASGGLNFYNRTDSTSRLFLDGSGNVGIANSLPTAKLHMSSGTLIVDGTSPALVVAGTADTGKLRLGASGIPGCILMGNLTGTGCTECGANASNAWVCGADADCVCDGTP